MILFNINNLHSLTLTNYVSVTDGNGLKLDGLGDLETSIVEKELLNSIVNNIMFSCMSHLNIFVNAIEEVNEKCKLVIDFDVESHKEEVYNYVETIYALYYKNAIEQLGTNFISVLTNSNIDSLGNGKFLLKD